MKRSLHIGINDYPGTSNDLSGCVNDANDFLEELKSRDFETTSLLNNNATKVNIINAITKLIELTTSDDILVITYSGHGTWTTDLDGDEDDQRDEAICPYDVATNILLDDELNEIFSKKQSGATIVFISDSCHSGTVSKMCKTIPGTENDHWNFQKIKYMPAANYIKNKTKLSELHHFHMNHLNHNNFFNIFNANNLNNFFNQYMPELPDDINIPELSNDTNIPTTDTNIPATNITDDINYPVILLAACQDTEYSYDAWFNSRANGAFTYVALNALKELSNTATYIDWYNKILTSLPSVNYPQTPKITGNTDDLNKIIFE